MGRRQRTATTLPRAEGGDTIVNGQRTASAHRALHRGSSAPLVLDRSTICLLAGMASRSSRTRQPALVQVRDCSHVQPPVSP